MKKVNLFLAGSIMLVVVSCSKIDVSPTTGVATTSPTTSASIIRQSNGISSAIPAYYDSTIFNILFVEFSPQAEASQIAHNPGINFIYQSDPGLPNNQPFISVIDAIPSDGMNPVWREVQIEFNAGFTPRQFYSDDQVFAAVAGPNSEITLHMTNEVYWCPIIGKH